MAVSQGLSVWCLPGGVSFGESSLEALLSFHLLPSWTISEPLNEVVSQSVVY